ncbi:hypothetical protein [Pseudomonas sp. H3(2019)]|uniref:hypothetical protein n=1 Tax=Pseudomonas sp. H3(2019) TaxID=2598724 RepID=UPI0035326CCF
MTRYLKELLLLSGIGLKPRRSLAMPGYALIAAPLAGVKLLSAVLFVRAGQPDAGECANQSRHRLDHR